MLFKKVIVVNFLCSSDILAVKHLIIVIISVETKVLNKSVWGFAVLEMYYFFVPSPVVELSSLQVLWNATLDLPLSVD